MRLILLILLLVVTSFSRMPDHVLSRLAPFKEQSELSCREISGERINCKSNSNDDRYYYDSTVYLKKKALLEWRTGYELTESLYDENHSLMIGYSNSSCGSYYLNLFDRGKITYEEEGCDTIQANCKDLCLEKAESFNSKKDTLGNYVHYRASYAWDEKGRLKSRTVWYSDNIGRRYNGTYTYTYGTPCDSVKVEPVDGDRKLVFDGLAKKGRYDGSFGKMPEVGDPEYAVFAKDPYSIIKFADKELVERQKKRCEDYKKSLKKK